jgi:hypothetical protein
MLGPCTTVLVSSEGARWWQGMWGGGGAGIALVTVLWQDQR